MEEFYAGKTVALTGGTGFLGKGLIEKLLRCCPKIKKIFLLIRSKKNVDPNERLETLEKSSAFDQLRKIKPNFAEKLSVVSCNLQTDDLGLNENAKLMLIEEVDIFIHSAATLRFTEHLRIAFEMNVKCVRSLLRLCKQMKQLRALVHISTAYSHCEHSVTNEQFYDCGLDYNDLESSLRLMTDEAITKITPDILGDRPNTYILTKALAEDLISKESGRLPVCIARPSMIVSALKEPSPGWCDNVYGPTAIVISYQNGLLKSCLCDEDVFGDMVPVDFVVNGVLVAAMKTAKDYQEEKNSVGYGSDREVSSDCDSDLCSETFSDVVDEKYGKYQRNTSIPIYTFNSCSQNPIKIGDITYFLNYWQKEYPAKPLRLPGCLFTKNRFSYRLRALISQTLPSYAIDAALALMNKKRKMVYFNSKLQAGLEVMEFFYTHHLVFNNENAMSLLDSLSPEDKKAYNFNCSCFVWQDFFKLYMLGTQQYILKADVSDHSEHKLALQRLKALNIFINSSLVVGTLGLAASSGTVDTLWDMANYLWGSIGSVIV